jgi:asparagine N-glycosylation enzyme membrane subunit Stt3
VWAVTDSLKRKQYRWAIISLVPLAGPFAYYMFKGKPRDQAIALMKSRWTAAALLVIILLSTYVRLIDFRWNYLRNIDSYVFYRQMDEIVQNNGLLPTHDIYTLAPVGNDRPLKYIYVYEYLGAYSYMLTRSFVQGLTLENYLIYFPALLISLAVIPLYFIGKMLYDRKAGVLAAFIFVFDISNLSRTLGGDPDSDGIVILVSMITMAFLIFTYKYSEGETRLSKRLLLYSVITAVVLWVWYSTWAGYWYVFWLFTGFIVLRLLAEIFKKKNLVAGILSSKYILMSFGIMFILSFALTVPLYSTNKITSALLGPIQFQSIKGEDTQFPNVYVSVAELQQSGGPREVIERTSVLGGPGILISPFFLMIYALVYLIYSFYKKGQHMDTVLLLLVWFLGPFAATIVAVRFSILFSAPLAIGSAILLSKLIRMTDGEDNTFGD